MLQIETYATKKELERAIPLSYLKQVFACAKEMPREYKKCECGKWYLSINKSAECPNCHKAKIIARG